MNVPILSPTRPGHSVESYATPPVLTLRPNIINDPCAVGNALSITIVSHTASVSLSMPLLVRSTPPLSSRILRRNYSAQTVTGHGYTGDYYQRMRIPDTSPWCPCSSFPGARILQTSMRVLTSCPIYAPFRHLRDKLFDPEFSVYELGSPDYSKSLLHFMHKSGAFTKLGTPFHLHLILPPDVRDRMRLPHFPEVDLSHRPP